MQITRVYCSYSEEFYLLPIFIWAIKKVKPQLVGYKLKLQVSREFRATEITIFLNDQSTTSLKTKMNYHDNITLLAIISDKTQTQSLRSVSHSHLHCCTDHYQLHSLTLVLSLLSVRVPKIHSSQSLISRCSSCRSRRWSTLY